MFVVRPARLDDFEILMEFAHLSGAGFTSLPEDAPTLKARLEKSVRTFLAEDAGENSTKNTGVYLLMVENARTKEVIGCSAVKTKIGADVPFFNFRIATLGQSSKAAGIRFDMSTLVMVNDYTGATEVGTLFLNPLHRGEGAGKLLSLSRFMLMASKPELFGETVVSELRGLVHVDGRSPFWEGVGRPFYRMDFADADNLSGISDNQFIIDLAPRHPIYIDLLPDSARGAIAQTHPDGVAARRLLEREGLRFEGVIDIFDGGPLLACRTEFTRTRMESLRLPVEIGDTRGLDRALISNDKVAGFRCTLAPAEIRADKIIISKEALNALNLKVGEIARIRGFDV